MSLLTYLSGYEGTINDKTMSWLRTWSPWMPNGTMEDLWMAFLQGYQGSLNDRMLAWARATSGLSGGSLNDALLGLPDGGAQYGGASLGLYFDEDKYESGAVGAQPISKPFGDIITFTRASGGGRFNSSGAYEWLGNNVPRLDYAPVTLAPRGLLIEEQRTNLLTYSEQINSTTYNTTDFPVTLTANAATSPSGLVNASLLSPTTSSSVHMAFRAGADAAFTSGTSYTKSVFAKDSGGRFLQLTFNSVIFGLSQYANFDLQTGTIGAAVGGTASIIPAGNGWYRCSFTATATSSGTASPCVLVLIPSATSGRLPSFVGVPANGIYIWGAQFEAGAFPTSYIPTVASQVTRSADVASVNTLSPWYNASEGTIVVKATRFTTISSMLYQLIKDASNRIWCRSQSGGSAEQFVSVVGGVNQAVFTPAAALTHRSAFAYKENDFAVSLNGASALTDVSGSVPSGITRLDIGHEVGLRTNGHIQSLEYYPRRLSNTELQEITA